MPLAAPPLVGLRCGPCLGPWARLRPLCDCASALCCLLLLRSRLLLYSVRCLPMLLCRLRLHCSRSSAAPLSPMRELAGAPPPLVRRLVGALLLVAPPLRVATPLRVPSAEFPLLPPAPLPVGLRRRIRLGPWVPLRSLCDCSRGRRCLSLYRSRLLSCSVRPLSWLSCCLLLVWPCCRLCLRPWALLRPLCDCSWALCCL